jgi:alpha-1,2-mannosyltransferase
MTEHVNDVPMDRVRRRSPLQQILIGLVIALVCVISTWDTVWNPPAVKLDFASFYLAAKAVHNHANPYHVEYLDDLAEQTRITQHIPPYLYPPFLAVITSPFSTMQPLDAQRLLDLASVIACIAIVLLTTTAVAFVLGDRGVASRPSANALSWQAAATGLALFFILPFQNNFLLGQINIILLLIICIVLLLYFSGKMDFLSGFLLSIPVLIKIVPIVLLLLLLSKGKAKTLVGFLTGVVLFGGISLLIGGTTPWVEFSAFLPAVAYGQPVSGLFYPEAVYNFSLAGFFSRLLPGEHSLVSVASTACLCVMITISAWSLFRAKSRQDQTLLLLPILVVSILSSSWTYLHHVVYIYPGAAVCLFVIAKEFSGSVRFFLVALLLALCLLAGFDFPATYSIPATHDPISMLSLSINLYALLTLFSFGIALYYYHILVRSNTTRAEPLRIQTRHTAGIGQ